MIRHAALLVAIAAVGCAPRALPTPAEIVAAERAFAADGYRSGIKASFLKYAAPDGIVFNPGPTNAQALYRASPDEDLAEPRAHLVWWPLYAGIARSGDLGFTTGPYAIDDDRRGYYFTIWKKQADGAWKWLLDAGVGADASDAAAQDSDVAYAPTSREGSASPQAALSEISVVERNLAVAAADDLRSAYGSILDDMSRLHSAGAPPAVSAAGHQRALAARPGALAFSHLGGGASDAGDLVWTYGEGRWADGDVERVGHYVRVWRRGKDGWRLLFDEFLPPPAG